MSIEAVLETVADVIRTNLGVDAAICDVGEDGHPDPDSGEIYYSVHMTNWGPGEERVEMGLHEMYSLSVTITKRIRHIPTAKVPRSVWLQEIKGLNPRVRQVMGWLHMNYAVLGAINALIPDPNKLNVPLQWAGNSTPRREGPDWFYAVPDKTRKGTALVIDVNFRAMNRIQVMSTFA